MMASVWCEEWVFMWEIAWVREGGMEGVLGDEVDGVGEGEVGMVLMARIGARNSVA